MSLLAHSYRSRGDVTITVDGSGFEHISTVQMVFTVVLTYNVSFNDGTTELEPVTREFEAVSVRKIHTCISLEH